MRRTRIYGLNTILSTLGEIKRGVSLLTPSQAITISEIQRKLRSAEELLQKEDERSNWIPCGERYPENEKDVEVTFVRKHWRTGEKLYFTARAFYMDGTMNTEDSQYCWDCPDDWEYDEEKDGYIIPEGWWETSHFAEENGINAIDMPVIAWRPLPEPYKEG